MAWQITPRAGLSDLRFGMSREDVEAVIGLPGSVKTTRSGRTRLEYGHTSLALVFVDDALVEINLLPEISGGLVLDGLDLMTSKERDVVAALRKRDDAAKERNGFLIFSRLGIALSGFEPPEADQKAVTVFGPNHPWSTP
ncbi:outer membrane protein assembly factor BamE [Aliirhizobium smilacinae]|uniref:Outer membrane protein assembly factor BamE n=1 Tax=Aliirhizobium smilacinae TaxID=1395944 RepID=A0A5C4X924_9HYPH|nr:outer membrane protein assembly factor BamE [Rhizobium smilacinae]TNM59882.1 outer membrane protein assembly factor BamE [Rhizobium smilacinae]